MSSFKNTPRTGLKGIQHSFQPVYYFSRFSGLLPFTIAYDSNGSMEKARVYLFDIFWCLISICLYLAGLVYAYEDVKNAHKHTSIMYFIVHVPCLLCGPVCIALDMLNRKRLVNILDNFIIFDREVRVSYFCEKCNWSAR